MVAVVLVVTTAFLVFVESAPIDYPSTGGSNLTDTVSPPNGVTSSNATGFISGIHVADSPTTVNQSFSSSQPVSQSLSTSHLAVNTSESKEASITSSVANQLTPEHTAEQHDSPPKVKGTQQQTKKLSADKVNEIGFNDKYLASQNRFARHRNVIFDGVVGDVLSFSNYHVLGHQEVIFGRKRKKRNPNSS